MNQTVGSGSPGTCYLINFLLKMLLILRYYNFSRERNLRWILPHQVSPTLIGSWIKKYCSVSWPSLEDWQMLPEQNPPWMQSSFLGASVLSCILAWITFIFTLIWFFIAPPPYFPQRITCIYAGVEGPYELSCLIILDIRILLYFISVSILTAILMTLMS